MNKNIATGLIVGSVILFDLSAKKQALGSKSKHNLTSVEGVLKRKYTNPQTGKESYIVRPDGKREDVFFPKSLIKRELILGATNTDARGNAYSYAGWQPKYRIILWIPTWFYKRLRDDGAV